MGRDDLYTSIPSFFRCPISLDVMKSPVSLCTGVTYDRTSIQRWLDTGNNTCPATMQVLHTKDLVPNHTLERLIQIWSESVNTRQQQQPPDDSVPSNSLSSGQVKSLIDQLKSNLLEDPPFRIAITVQCINKLMFFAKQSDHNSNFLSGADSDLLPTIISRFNNVVSVNNILLTEKLVQILHLLLKNYRTENQQIIVVDEKLVGSMIRVLQQGKMESKILVSSVLKMLIISNEEYKELLGENEEVYGELLKLMGSCEWDKETVENCLGCLLSISMYPKKNRTKLVRSGAVGILTKALLCEGGELKSCSVEKVLKLLEMISTSKVGRGEICGDEKCVGAIVKKVLKVSTMGTEHAVTILWSLCCLFRDQKAVESVWKSSNGLTKLLLLLQSNISPATRQMCSDLLKVFKINYNKNSSSSSSSSSYCLSTCYDTKTTHIMPF